MILPFVKKLFLILPLITISRQSKDKCNGSCLTKTYNCRDLASVTFTAKQIEGINYFTIILTGYNIKETEYQQVSVSIDYDSYSNTYLCERNPEGSIASYYKYSLFQSGAGSSLYRDNTLYCFWTMSKENITWPRTSDGSLIDLEIDPDHKIVLANYDTSFLVAENTEELPIYQMQFLKCCNEVYGNDKVQLFVKQTDKSNDFTLQLMNGFSPSLNNVNLELSSDGITFYFDWCLSSSVVAGYLKIHYVGILPFDRQFLYYYAWSSRVSTWSIPIVIKGFSRDYDTRTLVFDLKISMDEESVYKRNGLRLISFGSTQTSSIFFVFLTFLFCQFM